MLVFFKSLALVTSLFFTLNVSANTLLPVAVEENIQLAIKHAESIFALIEGGHGCSGFEDYHIIENLKSSKALYEDDFPGAFLTEVKKSKILTSNLGDNYDFNLFIGKKNPLIGSTFHFSVGVSDSSKISFTTLSKGVNVRTEMGEDDMVKVKEKFSYKIKGDKLTLTFGAGATKIIKVYFLKQLRPSESALVPEEATQDEFADTHVSNSLECGV